MQFSTIRDLLAASPAMVALNSDGRLARMAMTAIDSALDRKVETYGDSQHAAEECEIVTGAYAVLTYLAGKHAGALEIHDSEDAFVKVGSYFDKIEKAFVKAA